jgi:hypothetical protein
MQNFITAVRRLPHERIAVWALCTALLAVCGLYMYFVVLSVAQVVLREELALSIRDTRAEVTVLESEYFARLSTLSTAMLPEYDLVAVAPSEYVTVAASDRLTRRE